MCLVYVQFRKVNDVTSLFLHLLATTDHDSKGILSRELVSVRTWLLVYIQILPVNTEYYEDLIYDYAKREQQQTESSIPTLGALFTCHSNSHYRLSMS